MLSKDFYLNGYQKVLINPNVKVYGNDYWEKNIYINILLKLNLFFIWDNLSFNMIWFSF